MQVDTVSIIDHAVRTLTPLVKKDVMLEKVIHDKLPPMVADSRRLLQVVSNVLSNAIKFTEKVCKTLQARKALGQVIPGCGAV